MLEFLTHSHFLFSFVDSDPSTLTNFYEKQMLEKCHSKCDSTSLSTCFFPLSGLIFAYLGLSPYCSLQSEMPLVLQASSMLTSSSSSTWTMFLQQVSSTLEFDPLVPKLVLFVGGGGFFVVVSICCTSLECSVNDVDTDITSISHIPRIGVGIFGLVYASCQ